MSGGNGIFKDKTLFGSYGICFLSFLGHDNFVIFKRGMIMHLLCEILDFSIALDSESKEFTFWIEFVAPDLFCVIYLFYVICELLRRSRFILCAPKE